MPQANEKTDIELMNDGWTPVKEPKKLINAVLISIPLMLINALISIVLIIFFSVISLEDFGITTHSITITINLGLFIWIFLLVIVHELLHLIFVPNFIKSQKTFIGLTYFGGYVSTEEKLSKRRYILVTIAPFVILSMLLPLILSTCGILTPILTTLILFNSIASSVDIFNFILISVQIPKNASLISNGTKTYWKIEQNVLGMEIVEK